MNKEILLISANTYKVPYPVYPIGILYLQTYLNVNLPEFSITNFDCNLDSIESLNAILSSERFAYVGISLRNVDDVNFYSKDSFASWYKTIIDEVKNSCKAITIIGGSCFSIFPREFYEFLSPDYGIRGEGEIALFQLINGIEKNLEIESIEGLVYRKEGITIINPRSTFVKDLELQLDDRLMDYYWDNSGMLNIQTKRGCPFNCIYCSYPVIEGSKVRTLEPGKVVDTLEVIFKEKGIDYIFFTDSVFNIDEEYNIALAKSIIERGLNIRWGAYFSPFRMKHSAMELFKRAGLTHVEFGTDSFSDRQLKNMQKHFKFEDVLTSSQICYDLNIFYAHFLILGGYGETEDTLNETFENSMKIDYSVFFPFIGMRIYPNTRLFEIAKSEGKIKIESSHLDPIYYISDQINLDTIKDRAYQTKKKWIFPDNDSTEFLAMMRAKKRRGPLWEHLRY
jgi:radical SAM superfamily enzyme YgiQ (UPF0313 family)